MFQMHYVAYKLFRVLPSFCLCTNLSCHEIYKNMQTEGILVTKCTNLVQISWVLTSRSLCSVQCTHLFLSLKSSCFTAEMKEVYLAIFWWSNDCLEHTSKTGFCGPLYTHGLTFPIISTSFPLWVEFAVMAIVMFNFDHLYLLVLPQTSMEVVLIYNKINNIWIIIQSLVEDSSNCYRGNTEIGWITGTKY